jgi:hypothetical protein
VLDSVRPLDFVVRAKEDGTSNLLANHGDGPGRSTGGTTMKRLPVIFRSLGTGPFCIPEMTCGPEVE